VPAPAPAPAAAPAAEKPAGFGRLTLDTVPWTDVFLGSMKLGTTPLVEVKIPAGSHHLRLVNPDAKIDKQLDVTVAPDATVTLPRTRL
jgi:serine/threonine-protein kinase